jgi:ornithine cyclodeaminase/alanine dehydrogenase-like protein (mu-crystallin family)
VETKKFVKSIMQTLILSSADIRYIVQRVGLHALMDALIERLTTVFRQYDSSCYTIPARSGFTYENPYLGLIEWMPVMQNQGGAAIKVVGYHPSNPVVNSLPTILSTISCYDTRSGHLVGIADATFLTAMRTGAASAIATRVFMRPSSRVVGLIGGGAQAVSQLHALSRIMDVEHVLVYDSNPEVTRTFPSRVDFLGLEVTPITRNELPRLVSSADVICTATSVDIGEGAVFEDRDCQPHLHVNAVGADFPGKFEVPLTLLQRSYVCPDFPEQAIKEGECQRLTSTEIGATLVEVIQQPERYDYARYMTSVFDSTGWALEDQVAMETLLDYAGDLGIGTSVELESASSDPRDPYHFARTEIYLGQ